MYPVLFEVGDFEITSFGVLLASAFLVAGSVLRHELRRRGEDPDAAWSIVTVAVIGGVIGGRLYYALLHWPTTVADPWAALTARGGLVWYGGFLGATAAIIWYLRRVKLPTLACADAMAPALAVGYAVGRIGCFLVGDDYGRPADLPWAVRFAEGPTPSTALMLRTSFGIAVPPEIADSTVLAVHPTQVYETLLMGAVFMALWLLRRRSWRAGNLFSLYLVLAGLERLFIEVFRAKDDRFVGSFTLAQIISIGVITTGVILIARRSAPGRGRQVAGSGGQVA